MFHWLHGFKFDAPDDKGAGNPTQEGAPQPAQTQGATFSQDDVNAIAAKVRDEARQAAQNGFLKDLGVDNADTLKALVARAQAQADAEKTAQERLAELAPKAERLTQVEQYLKQSVESKLLSVPEAHREAVQRIIASVPTPEAQLEAIDLQLSLLNTTQKPSPPNGNASEGNKPQGAGYSLTQEQIDAANAGGMSLEEYAQYLKKARGE